MRFAVGVPNVGEYGDPRALVQLAVAAEEAGWDGIYVWDHILYHDPSWPVADPLVAIAAIAGATSRIRIGVLMVALPRRRPWKVAKELATLDHLSEGRMIAGVGLGSMDAEYAAFGETADLRVRAARLDEGLEIVSGLLSGEPVRFDGHHFQVDAPQMLPAPVQRPRVPLWIAGKWPNRTPFRRAARWDGVMPVHADYGKGETMPPEVVADVRDFVARHRGHMEGFDLGVEGATEPSLGIRDRLSAYERAGLTWWVEALGWWRGDLGASLRRVRAGPP